MVLWEKNSQYTRIFVEGLPEFEDKLSDLDDNYNIIVLDDLMDLAKDSKS